jgi:hypothetical protein
MISPKAFFLTPKSSVTELLGVGIRVKVILKENLVDFTSY